MTRILICGDRNWTDRDFIARGLAGFREAWGPGLMLCHGGARGVDRIAGEEAEKLGIPVTEYRAEWERYGKAAGPIRNRLMFTAFKPEIVYAFHDDIEHSKGTRDMVKIAKAAHVETVVISHDAYTIVQKCDQCRGHHPHIT